MFSKEPDGVHSEMKKPKPSPVDCVVSVGPGGPDGESVQLKSLGSVTPLKRILGISLDCDKTEVSPAVLRAVQQSIMLGQANYDESWEALVAARRMLEAMNEQVRIIELDIQMLNLRKKALKRRTRILEKLAESLDNYTSGREAA